MHAISRLILGLSTSLVVGASAAAAAGQQPIYSELDITAGRPDVREWRPAPAPGVSHDERPFSILRTDLSPAWLIRCDEPELVLFHDLPEWGLQLPTGLAYRDRHGEGRVLRGETLRVEGGQLHAPWLIVFFDGGDGWERFDVPWLIVLQRRPQTVEVTPDGLLVHGDGPIGLVGSMPLYGCYKCPRRDSAFRAWPERVDLGVETWTWSERLPQHVVERADWWSRHVRAFPCGARETFSIEPDSDSLVVRMDFEFRRSADDWGTEPLVVAPVPPVLGLAHRAGWDALRFSAAIHDPQLATGFGPYTCAVGQETLEYRLDGLLRYIHELEQPARPTDGPGKQALDNLLAWLRERCDPTEPYRPPWGLSNMVWSTSGADFILPKLAGYLDASERSRLARRVTPWIRDHVLADEFEHDGRTVQFWIEQDVGGRRYRYCNGPGIGGDVFGDGGKLGAAALYTIWCYAHWLDGWEVVRPHYEALRRTFVTPLNQDFKSVGRYAVAELGDQCQPALALARLAYGLGDVDTYGYASYCFAREAVHHYVKSVGGEYFRRHGPLAAPGRLGEWTYPTNLLGHTVGWQLGGPGHGSTQWTNRYVRFQDESVGRLHRDHLQAFTRRELDRMHELWAGVESAGHTIRYDRDRDEPHNAPSVQRLWGLLLDPPLRELLRVAPLDAVPPHSVGYPLVQAAYARAAVERRHERLVARRGEPSPFVLGRQREPVRSSPSLVQHMESTRWWPVPTWYGGRARWDQDNGWQTPKENRNYGTGPHFAFGAIQPGVATFPTDQVTTFVDWTTQETSWRISRTPPDNLARRGRGVVARTSDRENDFYEPWRLIDGDLSTHWSSARLRTEARARWIEIEFPQDELVARLVVHTRGRVVRVESATDGELEPVEIARTAPGGEVRFVRGVRARRMRIHFAPTRWMRCDEVEAFAPGR